MLPYYDINVKYLLRGARMRPMSAAFDTEAEEAKLREAREREEEDVSKILSDKYGIAYTDLTLQPIDVEALRVIPEEKAREAEAAAFNRAGKHLSLAIHNPN